MQVIKSQDYLAVVSSLQSLSVSSRLVDCCMSLSLNKQGSCSGSRKLLCIQTDAGCTAEAATMHASMTYHGLSCCDVSIVILTKPLYSSTSFIHPRRCEAFPSLLPLPFSFPHLRSKKVKVAHTRLPSVRFRSWSRFFAVSLQVTWVINPAVGCHYFPPSLQLSPQPLRGLLPILLLGEQRHNGCEQFA